MRTIRLPIPPSVNQAYGNSPNSKGKGRYKTRQYKAWVKAANQMALCDGLFLHGQRPFVTGPAKILIRVPKIRGDISNRIKVMEDWLVKQGFTDDDQYNLEVTIMVDMSLGRVNWCEVDISPAGTT